MDASWQTFERSSFRIPNGFAHLFEEVTFYLLFGRGNFRFFPGFCIWIQLGFGTFPGFACE